MIEELRANGKSSYADFDLFIRERDIQLPEIKHITEDIPFRHGSLNFTRIDNEIYYENAFISYSFDIAEYEIKDMQSVKDVVTDWLYGIYETEIFDDYIPDFHFAGTLYKVDWTEVASQGLITAVFRVYPFKIANEPTLQNFAVSGQSDIIVNNSSSHRITPQLTLTAPVNIKGYSLQAGTFTDSRFLLNKGENPWTVQGSTSITVSYFREIL